MSKYPEVIREALAFEEKGAEYYQEQARKAENQLVKRLFLSLAVEENQHQLTIQEIYQAMQDGRKLPNQRKGARLQETIGSFFANLSEEERKWSDNVEALVLAMDLEKKGYAMYQKAAERTTDSGEKEFFRAMQVEEGEHLEALENVYYYLTDSEDWFAQEESKVWNWMVL